jgi:hypothetical protein
MFWPGKCFAPGEALSRPEQVALYALSDYSKKTPLKSSRKIFFKNMSLFPKLTVDKMTLYPI